VATKKLSPKQKKIATAANPTDKITGADFQSLKNKSKGSTRQLGKKSSMVRKKGM
jgi:hypothetical protein